MYPDLAALFERQGGVPTTAQILGVVSRHHLDTLVECTALERIWHGGYRSGPADRVRKLHGLDLACGEVVAWFDASTATFVEPGPRERA